MKSRPNDACPCGSGRKYKKCHGSPLAAAQRVGALFPASARDLSSLQRAPPSAGACWSLGALAERAGDFAGARDCYAQLSLLAPENATAFFALGNSQARLFSFNEARQSYLRAIELAPDLPGVWGNLGNVEKYLGRFPEALDCYRRALKQSADPAEQARLHSNLLVSLHYDDGLSHEALYEAHREWERRYAQALCPPLARSPARSDSREMIRIGYVSGSFDGRLLSHFLRKVLVQHDRSQFVIYLYSSTRKHDASSPAMREACDVWVDIASLDDQAAAQRIADDRIDLLVDLDGHVPGGRPLVFAHKPAPVQVEWLDYFDTSGMRAIDYLLTDPYTTPPDSPQRFAETPFFMPHSRFCYTAPAVAPDVAPMPCTAGAPFTFGSFNRHDKLHPSLLRVWAEVLHALPASRLLIKNHALQIPAVRKVLANSFAALGIERERLLLHGPSGYGEMLAEYAEVDVALDTFPYNGGLTTCECLWMGVPLVALEAQRMIGRQSAAMLRLLGLDDWVATTPADYVRLAVEWHGRREAVAPLRATLRQRMALSPLCDTARFTRDLEAAYREMRRRQPAAVQTPLICCSDDSPVS